MSDSNSKPEDELAGSEQPFVAHLIELRDRLLWAVAAVAIAAAALALYPGPGELYDILAIIRHITDREGNLLSYREVWHHD